MDKTKATLAIYGIQDRNNSEYPMYVHDHSICLMRNGKVEKFLQLERLSRRKRDNKLYTCLYDILKKEDLLKFDDYDIVFVDNVVGRTFINTEGNIRFEAPLTDKVSNTFEKGKLWWLDREKDAYVVNHELAHISTCLPFYGKYNDNSLIVHFDGGASKSNCSIWYSKDDKLTLLEKSWDLKYLSNFFNANAIVFKIIHAKRCDQNSVPGKMMGLASFGKYSKQIEDWLIKNNYFEDSWKTNKIFFRKIKEEFNYEISTFDQKDPFLQNILATIQYIFKRDFLNYLKKFKNKTNADYLYYSGGSALNIVTNKAILESGLFTDVYIPPCAEDSGLALGAASYIESIKHGEVVHHSPYLNNWGISNDKVEYSKTTIEELAKIIVDRGIVGVCNSYGEVGPRALGNRSLISLANSKNLAEIVSIEKKCREWYRPIAPIMLRRNLSYFTDDVESILSDYMLMDYEIKQERREEISGVVHINGSSRIQTITNEEDNPFMYSLLDYLDKEYKIKALVNTSFNRQGEPIVHTGEDAYRSSKEMNLDALVINGNLLKL
ncbi:MAG: hypothetical protein N4A32_02670 [Marinifilaceae bacterium]|jgi:carbamoyltransferase|nr:hypothetical protein [Marinifilaceae bacterium]